MSIEIKIHYYEVIEAVELSEDEKGLLDDKINTLAKEHNLHADDDRDDIKVKIAEEVYEESFQ